MRSKADETLVIVETLICPLQISHKTRIVLHKLIVKHIAIDAGGLGFKSRVGLIECSVATGSTPLRRFFGAVLPRR